MELKAEYEPQIEQISYEVTKLKEQKKDLEKFQEDEEMWNHDLKQLEEIVEL